MSKKPPSTMTREEETLSQIIPRDDSGNIIGRDRTRTPASILRDNQRAEVEALKFRMAKFAVALQKTGSRKPFNVINEEGFNVNIQDQEGKTPLHYAASFGNAEVIKALVEKGANLETPDYNGRTAMHWAAVRGGSDAINALIERGANLEAKDKTGSTPLLLAALAGKDNSVKALIERGASVDIDIKGIPKGVSRDMISEKLDALKAQAARVEAEKVQNSLKKRAALSKAGKYGTRNLLKNNPIESQSQRRV